MSVKPILFNIKMVRAILDGRKTVTRRVVKDIPLDAKRSCVCDDCVTFRWRSKAKNVDVVFDKEKDVNLPYRPGDVLYVRETWAYGCTFATERKLFYRADGDSDDVYRWRPSIHMPREAARIFLRVTDVRVERLQEIDGNGLRAEGFDIPCLPNEVEDQFNKYGAIFDLEQAKKSFSALWDSTIKPVDRERYGWAANPFCWVIEFEKCKKPEEG